MQKLVHFYQIIWMITEYSHFIEASVPHETRENLQNVYFDIPIWGNLSIFTKTFELLCNIPIFPKYLYHMKQEKISKISILT